MKTTGVAHKDCLLLYHMSALSKSTTGVDGMLVVETSADREALDNLVAHPGSVQVYPDALTLQVCTRRGDKGKFWHPTMQMKSNVRMEYA